ncbi:ATP-binding protein [Nocardioides sp. NPDC057772]|uniref:sensor histidine kinase n=1 Tax=Nocardioides sp. NPDC057772 TaxID=3346245 RepID=UPI003671CF14
MTDVRPSALRQVDAHRQTESPVLSARRKAVAWAIVVVGLPTLTMAGLPYRSDDSLAVVMLAYVLAVVGVAVIGGIAPAVTGAFASFALANFFLTEPYYTFEIVSRKHVVELLLFVVVSVLVSVSVEVGARNRAAQAARARALLETDRTRSAILAAVSHDLRTPLSSIKVAVSTLRQPDIDWSPEEHAELLATIEVGADRLDGVVTNLLALTRIQAGAVLVREQPVVADEVVARALISVGGYATHLPVDVPEDLPTLMADPDLLERVIANLVANALRFDLVGTSIRARAVDSRVEIAVRDHGPGVPPERWAEMFTAFRRLDEREGHTGTGLGLAIARGFCDAMGATLSATKTPGGGLTMTIGLETA